MFRVLILTFFAVGNCWPANLPGSTVDNVCLTKNLQCDDDCEDPFFTPLENCGEYCLCQGGLLTHEKCSDGLHFNPNTNLCDLPKNAGCDICIFANITCNEDCEDPIYAPLENCGEYCLCEGGVLTHEKCSDGLHFNPKTNLCDYPGNAGCEVEDVCISTNITCDEECEDPIYAPLENCGEYCLCEGGVLTHEKCSDGLHFNPKTNLCDYPGNAGCEVEDVCISTNITCNEECEDPIYAPLENCGEYCLCEGGVLTHQKCSDGLHFNPKTNLCDYAVNAGCEVEDVCISTNITCDEECEDPIYAPLENCGEYCLCEGGVLTHKKCSDGLHFNPKTNLCDFPDIAGCEADDVCNSANITCDEQCVDPIYASLENCDEYCVCEGGVLTHEKCSDGLHFNPRTNLCDYPENAGCQVDDVCNSANITCDEQCEDPIYAPLENCGEYCLCEGGVLTHEKCSDGLHFNPNTNLCDYPENAGCEADDVCNSANITCDEQCEDPIYTPLENCGEYCLCEGGILTHGKCSDGLHFNPKTNLCDFPENAGCEEINPCEQYNIRCEDECEDPIYTPLNDCNQYCKCLGGVLTLETCGSKLLFNPNTNLCDIPENVDCSAEIYT